MDFYAVGFNTGGQDDFTNDKDDDDVEFQFIKHKTDRKKRVSSNPPPSSRARKKKVSIYYIASSFLPFFFFDLIIRKWRKKVRTRIVINFIVSVEHHMMNQDQ